MDLTSKEIEELLEQGVLEIKTIPPMFDHESFEVIDISSTYKDELYKYLESIVAKNTKIRAKLSIELLQRRLEIQCFDETSKKEFLRQRLNDLNNKIDNVTLLVYGKKDSWKSMILDYYSISDYKELIETKKLKNVFKNEMIEEWIEISTLYEEIEFIQNNLRPKLGLGTNILKKLDSKFKTKSIENLTIKELDRKYDELNKIHKEKFGIDIPFGAFFFDEIKNEASGILDLNKKLIFYKGKLHFWTELSLKDSAIISEPEITERLIPLIKNEIDSLQTFSASKEPTKAKGLYSTLTDDQIETLFELLKGKFFDINTNPDHFKAIFKNEPLPAGFIPIKRVKKFTNTLLAYFIYELFQKENQSDYWHIAVNCFENAKNLKQSLKNAFDFNPERKPKGYEEIDIILKSIYSPLL